MLLVFGDDRLNLRQFENLMPEWLRIVASKHAATTAALRRFQRDRFGHPFWRNECSLVFAVSFLSAALACGRLAFGFRLFGMRMFRRRWQGRILRIPPQPTLQFFNPRQQKKNDLDGFRRKPLEYLWPHQRLVCIS